MPCSKSCADSHPRGALSAAAGCALSVDRYARLQRMGRGRGDEWRQQRGDSGRGSVSGCAGAWSPSLSTFRRRRPSCASRARRRRGLSRRRSSRRPAKRASLVPGEAAHAETLSAVGVMPGSELLPLRQLPAIGAGDPDASPQPQQKLPSRHGRPSYELSARRPESDDPL